MYLRTRLARGAAPRPSPAHSPPPRLHARRARPSTCTHAPSSSSAGSTAAGATAGVWAARQRSRSLLEVAEAGSGSRGGAPHDMAALEEGMAAMEVLLPGPPAFVVNLFAMKASDWVSHIKHMRDEATVLLDTSSVGRRIVTLKSHYPGLNLSSVFARRPMLLLRSVDEIDKEAAAVKSMLSKARSAERLLEAVPELLSPKFLLSCLATIAKWHRGSGRAPLEILESDPELIYRAQTMDQPLEPVYEDEHGNLQVPEFNYTETRTEWQRHIDETRYGGAPGPVIVHSYKPPDPNAPLQHQKQ